MKKVNTHRQAVDNSGVSLSAIDRWVCAERCSVAANTTKKKVFNLVEQNELIRLRKEVEQLRMECEILKKPQSSLRKSSNKISIY